ncbi:hypothetical protein AnigIFM59636_004629 [Aspergillus niger]|uniref:Uncharacterized protein n=1 Tax=Aspergillus niger TaxID=5061 RepID=A0A505IG01_ASPNG|nr:hypothetical protein CAN33_0022105 [Aspergillus niger]GJP88274.1 hypothetical protein AlacWU_01173 [Aspergillus niger]GKZ91933.1 hypothetical protein AnigIFM59636_004629 [Aspergillus niger]
MVFTIVTIVFLPLTFLSSIFALDIAQFTHGPSGRPQFQSWWIFPLIFGSSAAVAIPLIVVAFNVNDFIVTPYYKRKAGMTSSPLLLVPDANPPEGHMMPVDTGVDGSALCFLEKYRTSLKMINHFQMLLENLTHGGQNCDYI